MAGNDTYIFENHVSSLDTVTLEDDGIGSDTIFVSAGYLQTTINLGFQTASGVPSVARVDVSGIGETTKSLIVNGTIENAIGSTGADSILGNALGNAIAGDFDSPGGSGGDDSIYGYGGNDLLYGLFADDLLDGGDGSDRLFGGVGEDLLIGGRGNDTLTGGAGSDVILGNAGADRLTGGTGADDFAFKALSDSRGIQRDTITDFSRVQRDKIDLSDIDARSATEADDRFTFIGSSAFSGRAGQLQATFANGTVTVSADVNGDRVADFSIILDRMTANLVASDFIL